MQKAPYITISCASCLARNAFAAFFLCPLSSFISSLPGLRLSLLIAPPWLSVDQSKEMIGNPFLEALQRSSLGLCCNSLPCVRDPRPWSCRDTASWLPCNKLPGSIEDQQMSLPIGDCNPTALDSHPLYIEELYRERDWQGF